MLRRIGRLLLAFCVSSLVGAAVQVQLGILFKADLELVAAMFVLVILTLVTTLVLGIALAWRFRIGRAAAGLFFAVLASVVALGAWSVTTNSWADVLKNDMPVLLYIFAPAAAMILVQWLLLRRLQTADE